MAIPKNRIKHYTKKIFAENLSSTHFIKGEDISDCVTLFSRLKCQQCGLYSRAILCPPLLPETYPQFRTINDCKTFYNDNVKLATVFVFKNDGTKSWKRNKKELSHIEFKKRYGRQLKGVENGSAKQINRMMKAIETKLTREGFNCQAFIAGHCDICPNGSRCPNRENPPCKKRGMTSLEATGIDVYKLLRKLEVPYQYPCLTELTQVTLLVIKNRR